MSSFVAQGVRALVVTVCVNLAACSTIDQVLPPLKPSPGTAQPSVATETKAKRELCETYDFVALLDVDTAYSRAVRYFGFRTVQERKDAARVRSYGYVDDGFKHAFQSGAFARMADWTRIELPGERVSTWMGMEIYKNSATQSAIKGDVCYWEAKPGADQRAQLVQAIKAAMKP